MSIFRLNSAQKEHIANMIGDQLAPGVAGLFFVKPVTDMIAGTPVDIVGWSHFAFGIILYAILQFVAIIIKR